MTSEVERRPRPSPRPSPGRPLRSRIYGFGSIFGKTMRDSRRAVLVVALLLGLHAHRRQLRDRHGVQHARIARRQLVDVVAAVPPILQGLAGKPVNVGTLGGYLQYKYGTFFPIIVSLWSILALSATLAAEARRGSLEFVAATAIDAPTDRAREAVRPPRRARRSSRSSCSSSLLIVGSIGPRPAGRRDLASRRPPATRIWLGSCSAIAAGAVAFALAPFVGRGSAAGVAGAVMFGGFILNGYQAAIPALAPLANLTWFGWTANHIPLAGQFDWVVARSRSRSSRSCCFVVGVEAFARRDIGATSPIPTPSLPRALVGLRGPTGRAIGQNLPTSLAWGLGIGPVRARDRRLRQVVHRQLDKSPDFVQLLSQVFPGFDIRSVGGFLQLLFVEFGLILAGLAAATLVGGLGVGRDVRPARVPARDAAVAGPLGRRPAAVAIARRGRRRHRGHGASGSRSGRSSPAATSRRRSSGSLVLGLYAAALAGIGVAVGGLFGTSYRRRRSWRSSRS